MESFSFQKYSWQLQIPMEVRACKVQLPIQAKSYISLILGEQGIVHGQECLGNTEKLISNGLKIFFMVRNDEAYPKGS